MGRPWLVSSVPDVLSLMTCGASWWRVLVGYAGVELRDEAEPGEVELGVICMDAICRLCNSAGERH